MKPITADTEPQDRAGDSRHPQSQEPRPRGDWSSCQTDAHDQRRSSAARFFTVPEAAAYLGIADSTLYAMVSAQRIPYTKIGRLLKFDPSLLEKWIQRHTMDARKPDGTR